MRKREGTERLNTVERERMLIVSDARILFYRMR